ncbi:hypothetical protein IWW42_002640 [Coemansia sp. RSA 1085]|nr:hypothetical protein BX667DRAFT_184370 [Coemansia mojavensis]KAJ2672866.1 hypothetical protein IWW42_002640 [Coemansia sp. RSA 1085]
MDSLLEKVRHVKDTGARFDQELLTELYTSDATLVELREYAVRYSLQPLNLKSAPVKPEKPSERTTTLPTTSLCDVVNSLLEENRIEDGVRFLINVGSPALLQDTKVLNNLLAIFKPTHLIEEDLKKSSAYLLNRQIRTKGIDYSKLWKVDNEKRQKIVQAQQSAAMYLASIKMQFMRPWFDEHYKTDPAKFWAYLEQLVSLPQASGNQLTRHLEMEMYSHRLSVACVLLEQINADQCDRLHEILSSMFMRVVSEGTHRFSANSYPTTLLNILQVRFASISPDRCFYQETQLLKLLLDLTASAWLCEAFSRSGCAQAIAGFLVRKQCAEQIHFLDCISSDLLVIEIIDYILMTWYRVSTGKRGPGARAMHSSPASMAKTIFCLQNVQLPRGSTSTSEWHRLVCLLSALVQRSIRAFKSRLCKANLPAEDEVPSVIMLTNPHTSQDGLVEACQMLRSRIESQTCKGESDDDLDDEDFSSLNKRKMLYSELDLLQAFLTSSVDTV